jgi:DNA-binding response OmpR family regulator
LRVLIVEDDLLLGESLVDFLSSFGAKVKWLRDERNITNTNLSDYDVIVLDLMLNFLRGEDLISYIREKTDIPILVLTAKHTLESKRECFQKGADDYLTKPFEPEELLLRLKALSRRRLPRKVVQAGCLRVDLEGEVVFVGEREIKLSPTAWKVLRVLVEHRGKVVAKETIMNTVWGNKPVGDDVLRAYIKELRRKLPNGVIETYKGRGYRLKDEG